MDTEFKTDSTYTIIKAKFKATASSSFGLIIVFMDNVTKNVERFDIVSSHFSTVYENNVNMPWSELEDMITKMKWKGEYATNLTHDIQNSIEDLFEPGTGRTIDIWHALKKSQLSKTCGIFEEYLMRPTGDKNVKVEVGLETINKSDIEKVKRMREMKENKNLINSDNVPSANDNAPSSPSLGESAVVLDISILLSPISGIPLLDLKQGDKVLVKISEETSRGQYFIDLFNASQDNEVLPIPATIEQVTQSGKYYTVVTQIGPGIYGKAISEDNVKAKRYDPALDKRKNKNADIPQPVPAGDNTASVANPDEEKKESKNLIVFIIGGAILLLLLLVLILAS